MANILLKNINSRTCCSL